MLAPCPQWYVVTSLEVRLLRRPLTWQVWVQLLVLSSMFTAVLKVGLLLRSFVSKTPCQSGKVYFCTGFSVKALWKSCVGAVVSACTFQPNTRLSGKLCFVVCYLHLGTMVLVFAFLSVTPTTILKLPFLSSQKIIICVSCGVDGI